MLDRDIGDQRAAGRVTVEAAGAMSGSGWARVALVPDPDDPTAIPLDELHRRALAEAEAGLDAAIAELRLDAAAAMKVRAIMLSKAEALIGARFAVLRAQLEDHQIVH